MPLDTLAVACRLSGLSLTELWLEYAALGGSRSVAELTVRLALGRAWPTGEDRVLATAADEALVDAGLPPLGPSSAGR